MQKYDAELLAKNLNGIAEVFDRKPVTAGALQAWFDTLKEFPTERVMSVLIGWPKTHSKFPAPAEVWKVCNDLGIAEREKKAVLEKRAAIEWEKSPQGAKFLDAMKQRLKQPARSPKEHWRHVLETQEPGSLAHEYAKQVLKREEQVNV